MIEQLPKITVSYFLYLHILVVFLWRRKKSVTRPNNLLELMRNHLHLFLALCKNKRGVGVAQVTGWQACNARRVVVAGWGWGRDVVARGMPWQPCPGACQGWDAEVLKWMTVSLRVNHLEQAIVCVLLLACSSFDVLITVAGVHARLSYFASVCVMKFSVAPLSSIMKVSDVACHLSLTPTATSTDPPPSNSPIIHSKLAHSSVVLKTQKSHWN